jgi:pimeloyl-ACP methyl ester carboxylesterase
LITTPRFQNLAYFLIIQGMKRMPSLAFQGYVRTETIYDMKTGRRYIKQILADPAQRQQLMNRADAIVPALPRFKPTISMSRQSLDDLPLDQIQIPTLIIASKNDGDIGYENSIPSGELITVEQFGHFIWWETRR